MDLFGNSRELQFRTSKATVRAIGKPKEHYFIEKKEKVGRGRSEQKPIGEKLRVQGDDGFSLAELLG